MTPAVIFLEKQKATFELLEYVHDTTNQSFADEAHQKLGLDPRFVFKTLVVEIDSGLFAVAVVPSNKKLSMKKLAKALGAKKAAMADAKSVQNMSGYVLGGVSPFGQKKRLSTVLDTSSKQYDTIYVSGGRRGLELAIAPLDLISLLNANIADISA